MSLEYDYYTPGEDEWSDEELHIVSEYIVK